MGGHCNQRQVIAAKRSVNVKLETHTQHIKCFNHQHRPKKETSDVSTFQKQQHWIIVIDDPIQLSEITQFGCSTIAYCHCKFGANREYKKQPRCIQSVESCSPTTQNLWLSERTKDYEWTEALLMCALSLYPSYKLETHTEHKRQGALFKATFTLF